MSFQAYLNTIKAKTGKTPEDIKQDALRAGVLKSDMKATDLVVWLKATYGLGHGHCMALWNVFVTSGWVDGKDSKLKKG